jgi:hypothetical protein
MILLGQSNYLTEDPATGVGVLGIVILLCFGLWMLIRWLVNGPQEPDPWSDEVAAEIAKDDAVPLCHRCLAPHDSWVDFCPDCGAPVGPYTNWLPYPYLFSIGHTLRIGASGDFRRSPLTIAGFFCLGIAEYALFAPIYWFMLLKGLSSHSPSGPPPDPPPREPPSTGD